MNANDWKKILEENCQQINNLLTNYRNESDVLKRLADQMSPMIQEFQDLQSKLFAEVEKNENVSKTSFEEQEK